MKLPVSAHTELHSNASAVSFVAGAMIPLVAIVLYTYLPGGTSAQDLLGICRLFGVNRL